MLVETHYDAIHAFAFKVLGDRAEAEDCAQDVCLSLVDRLPEFRRAARPTTWLYRIVVNAARDRLRAQARLARRGEGWKERHEADEAANRDAAAVRAWLDEALEHLDETERMTVALVVSEGVSHQEAGDILGVSAGTVSWRMNRIRTKLARLDPPEPVSATAPASGPVSEKGAMA